MYEIDGPGRVGSSQNLSAPRKETVLWISPAASAKADTNVSEMPFGTSRR
jgi:hypothetical protein